MDEEQNQEQQVEQQIENKLKDTARKGAKQIGKAAKKAILALLKTTAGKIILAAILIIIAIIVVASTLQILKKSVFNGTSQVIGDLTVAPETLEDGKTAEGLGQAKGLFKIEDRAMVLDTEEFDKRMDEFFSKNHISPKTYGITDDYSILKEFLKAEALTYYPDFRTRADIDAEVPLEEGQIEGCIEFRRQYNTISNSIDDVKAGSEVTYNTNYDVLEYMPYIEFATELAKYGVKLDDTITQEQIYQQLSNDDVTLKYSDLKNKFTLDPEQNLVIVGLTTDQTKVYYSDYAIEENMLYKDGTVDNFTYSLEVKRIPYQEQVKKYAMPFELCMALLLTTENPEYCLEVAKLAQNSKIVLNIQDDTVTDVYTTVYSHESEFSLATTMAYHAMEEQESQSISETEQINAKREGRQPQPTISKTWVKGPEQTATYYAKDYTKADSYETIVQIVNTPNPKLNLVEAETWIASIKVEYGVTEEKTNTDNTSDSSNIPDLADETEFHDVGKFHNLKYPDETSNLKARGYVDISIKGYDTSERRYNKKIESKTEERNRTYTIVAKEVKETPQKFLSLLKVSPTNINEKGEKEFDLYNFSNNTEIKQYKNISGRLANPMTLFKSSQVLFYDMISHNAKTENLVETMKYLVLLYDGKTTYDESRFSMYEPEEFTAINRTGSRGGSYYGNNLAEKIWFALKDEGFSDYAAAGALGNIDFESAGLYSNVVQGSTGNSEYSISYTEKVDNGTISKDEFINHGPGGGGYGLAQWTDPSRKSGLYDYTIKDLNVSIANADAQIRYLIAEIKGSYEYHSKAVWMTRHGWTKDKWINATNVEDATRAFCHAFEGGDWGQGRLTKAQYYYDTFANGRLQKPVFSGDTIQVLQYNFPHYYQKNYSHVIYKSYDGGSYIRTVATSGCGPTSLAMVLSGLLNDASIDPETLVANLKEYYPDGSYHVRGVGSSNVIFATGFLQRYYGCKSTYVGGDQARALQALENGYPCIGHEQGHILAVIPVTEELRSQGYKFYILDSARGHSGAYRSIQDATNVVKGTFSITYVIQTV